MEKKNLIFDCDVPSDFKIKRVGDGTCGICYLTIDNMVYKEMFSTALDLYYNIKKLSKFDSEFISFPKTLIYNAQVSNENFLGYLMNYFNCIRIYDLDCKIDILKFIRHLALLEREVRYISAEGVTFFDLNLDNILYSESDGIKLVDTDLYEVGLYRKDVNTQENMIELSNAIMKFLFNSYFLTFRNERLNHLYSDCGRIGKANLSDFLYEFIECINKNRNTDVKTLKQLRNHGFSYYLREC